MTKANREQRSAIKMKVLFAFIATLAFATAKPAEEEKAYHGEHVLPTQMTKFDEEVFNTKVGECTMRSFTYSSFECQRKFYLSFRTNKVTPCGDRYNLLKECYSLKLRKCYEKVLTAKQLEKVLKETWKSLGSFKKMHCGETDFNIFKYFKAIPTPKACPEGTMEKLSHCAHPWYKLYRKDQGSLRLCHRYQKYADCAKRLISQCSFDLKKMAWVFNKDLNPFCDKDQLKHL